ncbi:MAG: hypothetical protein Kow0074_17240 [Candidatus Zixiibacteriota bacterium]
MSRLRCLLLCLLGLALGCTGTDTVTDAIQNGEVLFENGFEEADLFPADGSLWETVFIQTAPGRPHSVWERSDEVVHSGRYSAKAFAAPGTGDVGFTCGKASVVNHPLPIGLGSTVEYHLYYYLTSDVPVQLLDVECSTLCGGLHHAPGVRVIMTRDRRLLIDWKFLNWFENEGLPPPADAPPPAPKGTHVVPVGEWFELTLKMKLDNGGRGLTEVYVNGEIDSRVEGTNIAPQGLEALNQYPQIEAGITCNVMNNTDAATVYVDDVQIVQLENSRP